MAMRSAPSEEARKKAAERIFGAKTVRRGKGRPLFRSYVDVETKSSLKYLKEEAQKRGFHVVKIDKFYFILTGKAEIEIVC